MKRFPQGRGIIGALFLALLAACALFAWSEALPAAGDSRSIRSGDPALAVALLSGKGAADASGMIAGRVRQRPGPIKARPQATLRAKRPPLAFCPGSLPSW